MVGEGEGVSVGHLVGVLVGNGRGEGVVLAISVVGMAKLVFVGSGSVGIVGVTICPAQPVSENQKIRK